MSHFESGLAGVSGSRSTPQPSHAKGFRLARTAVSDEVAADFQSILATPVVPGKMPMSAYVEALEGAGLDVYITGGAVRDLLRGLNPTDIDMAANADRDTIENILRDAGLFSGYRGMYAGVLKIGCLDLEGMTYTPQSSEPQLVQDLRTRDFTVNALYYHIKTKTVVDPLGTGLADLERGLLREVCTAGQTSSWLKSVRRGGRYQRLKKYGFVGTDEVRRLMDDFTPLRSGYALDVVA